MCLSGLALMGQSGLVGALGLLVYFFCYNSPQVFAFQNEVREVEVGIIWNKVDLTPLNR